MDASSLESYDFQIPRDLIASKPIYPKSAARLLVYERDSGRITHSTFARLWDFMPKDALIVLNDTKVIKARIFGRKMSGARIELLCHKPRENDTFLVQINGRVKAGDMLVFEGDLSAKILGLMDGGMRIVEFYQNGTKISQDTLFKALEKLGHTPLPPYIKRDDEASDECDYQSVFATNPGAIAAPTASLHLSEADLAHIRAQNHCFITLHIGAGTFFSVESADISRHKMHAESFIIPPQSQKKLDNATKILCVGTTSCRCVEAYHRTRRTNGECDIFLSPLNPPQRVDYILTNFHLPKSSLIMLVAAFVGVEKMREIYQIAIDLQYRFYSYGDGMLIL